MKLNKENLTIYSDEKFNNFLRFGHDRSYWKIEPNDCSNLMDLTIIPLSPLKEEVDFCVSIPYDGTLENLLENVHRCYLDLKVEDLISNWVGLANINELHITMEDIVRNAKYCKSRILLCYTEMMIYYYSI